MKCAREGPLKNKSVNTLNHTLQYQILSIKLRKQQQFKVQDTLRQKQLSLMEQMFPFVKISHSFHISPHRG